jgi:hypothetical protein
MCVCGDIKHTHTPHRSNEETQSPPPPTTNKQTNKQTNTHTHTHTHRTATSLSCRRRTRTARRSPSTTATTSSVRCRCFPLCVCVCVCLLPGLFALPWLLVVVACFRAFSSVCLVVSCWGVVFGCRQLMHSYLTSSPSPPPQKNKKPKTKTIAGKVYQKIMEIESRLLPCGLHTVGVPPTAEEVRLSVWLSFGCRFATFF